MNLILFRKTIIVSSLTETEVISRLSQIVDLKKRTFGFGHSDPTKQYVGKIESRQFKIHRIIKGRNSFIPIIQGNIIDNFSTTSIELKMRLHLIIILFLLWLSGFVVYDFIKLNDYTGLFFTGLLFAMTIFLFNLECNKSIKDLKDIFIA